MEQNDSSYLRELLRILIRNLGILEKSEASCCETTISQCHAIVEIGRSGQISLNDLAELLMLDKSTMSRTINGLVEDELVTRTTHATDRRYINIELTEKGTKTYEGIESSMDSYYKKILADIPQDKRSQVLESLKLLTDAVRNNK